MHINLQTTYHAYPGADANGAAINSQFLSMLGLTARAEHHNPLVAAIYVIVQSFFTALQEFTLTRVIFISYS